MISVWPVAITSRRQLESAHDASHLPTEPSCKPALNDLLLRVRGVRAS